jgi:hemerythrin-like metal-binding protein
MEAREPDLLLNHELLDDQHAEIFRRLGALARALDGPSAEIEPAAAALADALVTHLATEERIMDDALYPERARHRSAHELFMADFLRFRAALREEGPTAEAREWVVRRIPEWLRFHISVNDFPLGVYLARRAAKGITGHPATDGGRRPS